MSRKTILKLGVGLLGLLSAAAFSISFWMNWRETQPKRHGLFQAQPVELARLWGVPPETVRFRWADAPDTKRGIMVEDSTNDQAVALQARVEQQQEQRFLWLYLAPQYKEQLESDPAGARTFINTHLIQAYLLSRYEAEELDTRFAEFCSHDCGLHQWQVVQ